MLEIDAIVGKERQSHRKTEQHSNRENQNKIIINKLVKAFVKMCF